ncbi:MAG: hypothetical protein ACREQF_08025 [Candidatus Binataceae bacterium]
MELRELTRDNERQMFEKCLVKARAARGFGFRAKARSRLEKSHLVFGSLYAIFENQSDPAERMLGGFVMHDLASLPQSFPNPDLSRLPARSILEGSELWSLSTGIGRVAASAAAAVAGLRQAKAIIVYPVIRPVDLTSRYAPFNFVNACEPIRNPYGETLQGEELWVQPMILEGEKLEEYIRWGFDFLLGSEGGGRVLRFSPPLATRPSSSDVSRSIREETRKSSLIQSNEHPQESNGTTPAE